MTMKKTLVVIAVLAVFIAAFVVLDASDAHTQREAAPQAAQPVTDDKPTTSPPAPGVVPATRHVAGSPTVIVIDAPETDEVPPGAVEVTDPVELAQFWEEVRQRELAYLEKSPAKNTPEAKQIQAMLAVRGLDRSLIPACYNIAWNYQLRRKMSGGTPVVAEMSVRSERESLISKHPELNEDFWKEIYQIKPTVFFGSRY